MTNCTHAREQLALRLYDELDEREGTALQTHLADCAECRAFSSELGRGLGRLAASTPDDLPADWIGELHRRVADEPREPREPRTQVRRSNLVAGIAAGVGIAAGFLLGLASAGFLPPRFTSSASESPGIDPATVLYVRSDPRGLGWFRRSTPPPLALAGGDLSRLQTYLNR